MAVRLAELVARIQAGESDRAIARAMQLNRRTVARYRRWAVAAPAGATAGAAPALRPRPAGSSRGRLSSIDAYRAQVAAMLAGGQSVTVIRGQLEQQHGRPVSYSAVWRLVRRLQHEAQTEPSQDMAAPLPPVRDTRAAASVSDFEPAGARPEAGSAADELSNPKINSRLNNEEMLAERHAHLVATATDLLLHRGFHRTSVRDIAAAAGWQIGTLYLYISRKEDILYLILDEITRSFLVELRRVERQPTARATLRAAAERYFRVVARMHRELRLLYRESASLEPEQRRFGMQREFAQRDVLAAIIRRGIAAGEFRPVQPEEFAHTIIMLAHMWGLKGWALISMMSLDQYIDDQLDLLFARLDPEPRSGTDHAPQAGWASPFAGQRAGEEPESNAAK